LRLSPPAYDMCKQTNTLYYLLAQAKSVQANAPRVIKGNPAAQYLKTPRCPASATLTASPYVRASKRTTRAAQSSMTRTSQQTVASRWFRPYGGSTSKWVGPRSLFPPKESSAKVRAPLSKKTKNNTDRDMLEDLYKQHRDCW
jgi:hypothetical protein